jgi:type 1 glutamine amidotransferase
MRVSKQLSNILTVFFCTSLFCAAAFAQPKPRVLVFTKTQGFDHNTRTVADSLIRALGVKNGFDVDTANDTGTYFKDAKLATYKAVCFINVTGSIFNDSTKAAFQRYIRAGGGFVGMHACVDCEYGWHWYHELAGAYFANHHFGIAPAKLAVLDHSNPATSWIAKDTISRSDEWYFFTPQTYDSMIDPAKIKDLTVLINLVESSIPNSTENKFHPMCWCRQFDGGRSWYCGYGHDPNYFRDTVVQKTLLGGILWAAGMTTAVVPGATPRPGNALHNGISVPMRVTGARIYDIHGRLIRSLHNLNIMVQNAGGLWNHRDDFGRKVPAGRYFIELSNGRYTTTVPLVSY